MKYECRDLKGFPNGRSSFGAHGAVDMLVGVSEPVLADPSVIGVRVRCRNMIAASLFP